METWFIQWFIGMIAAQGHEHNSLRSSKKLGSLVGALAIEVVVFVSLPEAPIYGNSIMRGL